MKNGSLPSIGACDASLAASWNTTSLTWDITWAWPIWRWCAPAHGHAQVCLHVARFFSFFYGFTFRFLIYFGQYFSVFIIWIIFKNDFLKMVFLTWTFCIKKEQFLNLNNFQKIQIVTIFKYEYFTKYEPFSNLNIFQNQTFFWKTRILYLNCIKS